MSPDTLTSPITTPASGQAVQEHAPPRRKTAGPIVAAVGGSESSTVLPAARFVATVTANDVLAVSALEPFPLYIPAEAPVMLPPEYETEVQDARRAELVRQVEEIAGARSGWKTNVFVGDAARVVTDVARAERSPLLIMGIGRHRALDRLFSRETTLHAVRRASCPVLIVGPTFAPPFREIVIATDFSVASARAAEVVMPLLTEGATVHLVHIWQPIALNDAKWKLIDERYEESLPEKFRRFRATLNAPAGITIKEEVREGRAAPRVLDFASAHHVDLIVAGRQGLNALARLVVGSTTTTLIRGATCSLLVAPEPALPDAERLRRVLTGVVELRSPESWVRQLDDFSRRNRDRRANLELEDLDLGVQVIESGFRFEGASYDVHDHRVELMLAGARDRLQHVTRTIGGVDWIAIGTNADGRDLALRVTHGTGQTLLTFSAE